MRNSKEKTSDWFFRFILLKGILIIILLFYLFFDFQRGYGTTERSEFILTEINGYYKSNDRWKFIYFLLGEKWLK